MSVVFSGNYSGTFVSTGAAQLIALPAGADFMRVENETTSYAGGTGAGVEFFWRNGMTQGQGTQYYKTNAGTTLNIGQLAAGTGFYLYNTTVNNPGPSTGIVSISGDPTPLVTTAALGAVGLIPFFSIVRIYNTAGALQLAGMDFTVGTVPSNATFQLAYMSTIVNANGPGTFRVIPYNPYFYPSTRYITNITRPQDLNGVPGATIITLSVAQNYTIGQVVRLSVPTVTNLAYGTTQLDGMQATIININQDDLNGVNNTITVNIDSSGMSAFAFPLTFDTPFTPAQVIPMGISTAQCLKPTVPNIPQQNILADATLNTGQFGLMLMSGANSPAGVVGNIISWQVGKSFNQ